MIEFNQTIFNLYESVVKTTAAGFRTFAKGKCIDVLLPEESQSYQDLISRLTTMLLKHGGNVWLENEIEEVMGNEEGELIRMSKDPIGERTYNQVKGDVITYLRDLSIEYAFWQIETGRSTSKYLTVIADDEDGHLRSASIQTIPNLYEGKLPYWFLDSVRHYIHQCDKLFRVMAYLGDEPDIYQHGDGIVYPSCYHETLESENSEQQMKGDC